MMNYPDLIDDALMRPSRLGVKKEIGLPDENERLKILEIYCAKMIESKMVSDNVDLREIAALTKNFTGAELEGLVRAAQSYAITRLIKKGSIAEVDMDRIDELQVFRDDFMAALKNDVQPAYGSKVDVKKYIRKGIFEWGDHVKMVLDKASQLVNQLRSNAETHLISMLLYGPTGSGKTALATRIAVDSGFPFVKICSPGDLVTMNEAEKCERIKQIYADAYKSQLSCLVIDQVEELMNFNPIGPVFSNMIAQLMKTLFKKLPPKNHKLLVIATTRKISVLQNMEIDKIFNEVVPVDNLSKPEHVKKVLEGLKAFTSKQRSQIDRRMRGLELCIGIKRLIRIVGTSKQAERGKEVDKFLGLLKRHGVVNQEN